MKTPTCDRKCGSFEVKAAIPCLLNKASFLCPGTYIPIVFHRLYNETLGSSIEAQHRQISYWEALDSESMVWLS